MARANVFSVRVRRLHLPLWSGVAAVFLYSYLACFQTFQAPPAVLRDGGQGGGLVRWPVIFLPVGPEGKKCLRGSLKGKMKRGYAVGLAGRMVPAHAPKPDAVAVPAGRPSGSSWFRHRHKLRV